MPRVRRRVKRYKTSEPRETPEEKRARMLGMLGHPFIGEEFQVEEYRALWEEVGEEFLAGWIAERPGTRPWYWWQHDKPPEPRLMIDRAEGEIGRACWSDKNMQSVYQIPYCPADCPYALQNRPMEEHEWRPMTPGQLSHKYDYNGPGTRVVFPCEWFEGETAYLIRTGLLTDSERAALGR